MNIIYIHTAKYAGVRPIKQNKFLHYILPMLNKANSDELYLHLGALASVVFTSIMHLFLLILFIIAKIKFFIILNCFSLTTYVVAYILVRHKKNLGTFLVITYEATLYAFLSTCLLGTESVSIICFFLVLLLQVLAPYGTVRLRVINSVLIWLAMLISQLFAINAEPLIELSETAKHVLSIVNYQITFWGLLVQILAYNYVRRYAAEYSEKQFTQMAEQAHTDPLTGLYNRRFADVYFRKLRNVSIDCEYAVALLDIDDFKIVNDTYGHANGDLVLKELALLLVRNLRKGDMIFRWGGEEFLVVLENVNLQLAYQILDKARSTIEATPIHISNENIFITVTIGVCTLESHDLKGSIECSDRKMYQGKKKGKNIVIV